MSAFHALAILFLINVANYVARSVLGALLPLVQAEFHATDTVVGMLGSALMWTYMLSAPAFGHLADRRARTRIIAFGAGLWALGASACAFAASLPGLFVWRGVVGTGEAAFSSAAPAMIADLFPPRQRNRAMTAFYIAMPLGAGLGFWLGGALGERLGWRGALLLTGAPVLLLALLALRLREPARGALDAAPPRTESLAMALRTLAAIRSFRWLLGGQVLMTFAVGGVASWLPTFLVRAHGMRLEEAGMLAGSALVVGSLAGTVAGGALADLWERRSRNALIHTSSLGLAAAALLIPLFFRAHDGDGLFALLALINFFLFWHTGPANALLTNVVPAGIRATSVAVQITVIHLFGDAVSPGFIGAGSDLLQATGLDAAASLRLVLLLALSPALLLAAAVTQTAALWAPEDLARVVGPHALDR